MDQVKDRLEQILQAACSRGASDIHLGTHGFAYARVDGEMLAMSEFPIDSQWLEQAFRAIASDSQIEVFLAHKSLDFAYSSKDGSRFRINAFQQRGSVAFSIRRLGESFQSMEQLGLPPEFEQLAEFENGLVLVTGPTGCGKSTSLAAMIHAINTRRSGHVLTIEDPVEYIHKNVNCIVSQREVHVDVPSFSAAVCMAMREDPDVILIGEMRDLATMRAAMTAAETGHLVFSTLHTNDCIGAIDRIISSYPPQEQGYAREQLSRVLRAVVSQRLLPGRHDKGRVPAQEIMRVNHAISNLIRLGELHQIASIMQTSTGDGTLLLEQSLAELVARGAVSENVARSWSRDESILEARLEFCASIA